MPTGVSVVSNIVWFLCRCFQPETHCLIIHNFRSECNTPFPRHLHNLPQFFRALSGTLFAPFSQFCRAFLRSFRRSFVLFPALFRAFSGTFSHSFRRSFAFFSVLFRVLSGAALLRSRAAVFPSFGKGGESDSFPRGNRRPPTRKAAVSSAKNAHDGSADAYPELNRFLTFCCYSWRFLVL